MNKKGLMEFIKEEDGMGTVEIILIIVVLIGRVIIFKEQLNDLGNDIFNKITICNKLNYKTIKKIKVAN